MALNLSALRKPVNRQVIDPSTGLIREEWGLYFQQLNEHLNAAVGELGADPAPSDAQYIVGAANGTLTAERVATDTATVDVDLGTAAQAKWNVLEVPGIDAAGMVARTGAANYEARTITAPAAGITVSNGDGVSGNPTLVLANDLAAVEALSGTGIARRTGADAWSVGTQVATAEIGDDAVTYAKMQNAPSAGVIGAAAAGDYGHKTLSEVLDFIGSAAQGDILYRGASAWERLEAGTANHFLQTGGAGANPQYTGSLVLLSVGVLSAVATLDLILTAYAAYRGFKIFATLLPATDATALYARLSTNGGASYEATGYSWAESFANDSPASGGAGSGSANQIELGGSIGNATTEGVDVELTMLDNFSTARNPRVTAITVKRTSSATPLTAVAFHGGAREAAQDADALRLLFSTGNIASGKYALYGIL
jgi:hypothetical protein